MPNQSADTPLLDANSQVNQPIKLFTEAPVAESTSNNKVIHNPVVDGTRIGSATKAPDGQHGFPDIVDNYAGEAIHTKIKGNDGILRDLYQLEGGYKYYDSKIEYNQNISVNGVTHKMDIINTRILDTNGIFEWIVVLSPAEMFPIEDLFQTEK